ncbi:Leucine-rich repeat protein kinase family protein, partial [Prunus dulcis]
QLHASTITTTHLQTERHRFRWNHHTSFFPFQSTATLSRSCRRQKQPRNEAVLTALRPRIRSRRHLSGSSGVGLLNVSLECYKHYLMYLPDLELGYENLRYLEM